MNTVSRSILVSATLALLLMGCQKKDEPALTSSGQPAPTVTTTTAPTPQVSAPDPSLPEAAGKAVGTQDTTALQQKTAPQAQMSKEEEAKAMPMPGQANDHSTSALDKTKSK